MPIGRLATMICFNADFTDVARRYGNQGAQLIAIPSLFGGPIAELTYTQIVFCAIGNRTAIIMADVPLGMGRTLYSQIGGLFGWFSLAGMAFFILLMNSKHPENKTNPLSQKQRQHSQ